MTEPYDQIEHNRAWLREMREYIGWSTTQTAEHAREAASELNDDIRVSQQAVSAFENGKHKTTPRWLGYAQSAMGDYLAKRNMDPGRLWDLHLPQTMKKFFTERRAEIQGHDWLFDNGDPAVEELLSDPQSVEQITEGLGLVPVREIDLSLGMGATYLDVPVTETIRHFPIDWLRLYTKAAPEHLLFAQGVGDSMEPTLRDSDLLLIDCSQRHLNMSDKVWAITYADCGAVKRLRPVPGGGVEILSDNPSVSTATAFDGELHILGRVVATVRKM